MFDNSDFVTGNMAAPSAEKALYRDWMDVLTIRWWDPDHPRTG